jgi:hypothetical protein
LARARAARGAQSPAGSPRRGRASPLARSESTGVLGCRLDSTCRAARPRGSAVDDQLSSGRDWSKAKPRSSSQGISSADSSRGNSAGPPFGLPSGGAREGMSSHSRIRRATSGPVIADRIRIRPPHAGQRSTSASKTRWRRSAQAVRRGGRTAGVTNAGSRVRASVETGPDSIDPGRRTGEAGGGTVSAPRAGRASRQSLGPSIRVVLGRDAH